MPARLNAKGPGEFIRDHLLELPESRDYVGSMFQAYKSHVIEAGYKAACRPVFHKYIWLLKETGAIVFDGAEPSAWEGAQPPPPGYSPSCGMPAPRHYYRILDPAHPAFQGPEAAHRRQRGFPVARRRPPVRLPPVVTRLAPAPPPPTPVSPPPAAAPPAEPPPTRPPRLSPLERLEAQARAFRPRIEAMRDQPDRAALDRLEADLLDLFDEAVDLAAQVRGNQRREVIAFAERLERSAEAFQDIRSAAARADVTAYLEALDRLAECCPE
jgi:hypothetical protein